MNPGAGIHLTGSNHAEVNCYNNVVVCPALVSFLMLSEVTWHGPVTINSKAAPKINTKIKATVEPFDV